MTVPFGKEFRAKYFSKFDKDVVPVNHGSFGQTPDLIFDKYIEALTKDYAHADKYLRFSIYDTYVGAIKELATLFNCDYHNLAIVENATTAVNIILRSFPLEKGDKIVVPSTVYGGCGNTVNFIENRLGIEKLVVELNYPLSDDEIIEKYEQIFKNQKPKLAMFDVISSLPGVRFPFERMVQLCKKYLVLSLVDGAHSAGLVPIDLDELKPDFFTSNLHKWLFVPRPSAVMYVDPKHHRKIHTIPISHSYVDDSQVLSPKQEAETLIDRFVFVGSVNPAPIFTILDALKFRREICGGEEKIHDYCFDLAKKVGETISKKWNTSVLENDAGTLTNAMVNIEVPLEKAGVTLEQFDNDYDNIMQDSLRRLVFDYHTFITYFKHNNKIYVRFSCQIYNDLSDFEYASDVLLKVLKELVEREADSSVQMVPKLAKMTVSEKQTKN